jgi:hypothetical protein
LAAARGSGGGGSSAATAARAKAAWSVKWPHARAVVVVVVVVAAVVGLVCPLAAAAVSALAAAAVFVFVAAGRSRGRRSVLGASWLRGKDHRRGVGGLFGQGAAFLFLASVQQPLHGGSAHGGARPALGERRQGKQAARPAELGAHDVGVARQVQPPHVHRRAQRRLAARLAGIGSAGKV